MAIKFTAIVKEVNSKALVSGDKSYRVVLMTEDPGALVAASVAGDKTVTITIEE